MAPAIRTSLVLLGVQCCFASAALAAEEPAAAPAHPSSAIADAEYRARLALKPSKSRAKNVVIFIGDGMGPPLIAASRIYEGQQRGEEGEENYLSFERLPFTALVKTYSADGQVPDSAATASAIMTGVKARNGTVNIYPSASDNDCAATGPTPPSLAESARALGRSVGVVSTSYIVDATPAAIFGHAGRRGWVLPQYVPEEARAKGCTDLAAQLVASGVSVALGGGRAAFAPTDAADPEGGTGAREDGVNLVDAWLSRNGARYVWNADQLRDVGAGAATNLLGLFSRGAMFDEESENAANPTLAEMTLAAIGVLSKNEGGFVLLVEHEGTDEHQHAGHIRRAMDSAIELAEAVDAALEAVDLDETLVIVTADHGQTLAFGGYAPKGNPILGLGRTADGPALAADGKPYTTLGFYAGPQDWKGARPDLSGVDTTDPDFILQSAVPMRAVPHSGADVALYAAGPWAHLFTGAMDQVTIHRLVMHAMEPKKK